MTASVAGQYTGSRIRSLFQTTADARDTRRQSYRDSGERIARTLGELKGAAMKIGQMASIGSDVLPKELSEALAKLQRAAPPMPFSVIAGQIERELGSPPARLFDRFDREPFAAASIGQVHRARTDDGREVVVKVQYPGVDASVDSDLAHLKIALRASGLVHRAHRRALTAVFAEVRERLHEELDYCNEADNVRLFRDFHARHPFIVIPEVVGERSSQRVLTMTFEDGDAIGTVRGRYPSRVRDRIGERIFHMMASQLFELESLHADPNPANFAFREDGTIVVYDFGCVKHIEPEVITAYRGLIDAGIDEDYVRGEKRLFELAVRVEGSPEVPVEFYKAWRDLFFRPLTATDFYDFGASSLHQDAMKLVAETIRRAASFKPPPKLVFIDRAILGNYGNLRAIGARGQYMPLLKRYLDRDDFDPERPIVPAGDREPGDVSTEA